MDLHNQKAKRTTRRMIYPEGSIQKVDHRKDASHEVDHLQSFFYMIQGLGSKVKCDVIRSKRSTNKSEKLVNHQTTTFPLLCYFQRLRKKVTSSLSSLRPVDQRGSRLKICKLQRIYFEVYKKLEVEEEVVGLFENSARIKAFIFQSSQPSELPECCLL